MIWRDADADTHMDLSILFKMHRKTERGREREVVRVRVRVRERGRGRARRSQYSAMIRINVLILGAETWKEDLQGVAVIVVLKVLSDQFVQDQILWREAWLHVVLQHPSSGKNERRKSTRHLLQATDRIIHCIKHFASDPCTQLVEHAPLFECIA